MFDAIRLPEHVPSSLARDFNYFDQPDCGGDPHAAWKLLHNFPDIFYSRQLGGYWVVTRAADMKTVFEDPAAFSSSVNRIPAEPTDYPLAPIEYDPPEHWPLKMMAVPRFAPTAVRNMDQLIENHSNELIDRFIDRGECDFVKDYALYLPIDIFMRMAGLPMADRDMLLHCMEDMLRNPDDKVRRGAFLQLEKYSDKILAQRRENPGADLVSELIRSNVGGRPPTESELLGYLTLLWSAGLDTVSSAMGFMARFLAENPDHRRRLVDDPLIVNNAVEEMLRRFGVSTPSRIVSQDTVLKGVAMRKGDMVLLPVTLYGLDEREFPNPLMVDFDRKDAAMSFVFGTGIHRCIGSFLARTELRTFLRTWLRRIPEFHITPGQKPTARAGVVNSMLSLPLSW